MVLNGFFSETRRRWTKALKQLKKSKPLRKQSNRVTPITKSPYNGTVDATSEIDLQSFCNCRISTSDYSNSINSNDSATSQYSNVSNSNVSNSNVSNSVDSAYNSARSSPARLPAVYATVTYYNVDNEDSNSIKTEYTILEFDEELEEERRQNILNESLELVSSL